MSDSSSQKPFRCTLDEAGDGLVFLRPAGELDLATAPQLDASLREAHERGFRRLVVDLRGLEFMDSTGLTLLIRWTLEARNDGIEFAVVPGDSRIRRLFELTQLNAHFTFVDG